jgi:outer membrane translocation and assembly module TamA|tara:strand:+ start:13706 stop:16258 length:2553 start_codon:yes stop_codon:yes gene_type:complete
LILIENIPWKNTIFETNSFANLMKKLSLFFLLFILFASCNSTKHVAENEHLLTKNYIYVDSVRNTSGELQKYVLQKPNPRFLSLPFGVYFHNIGNHKKTKTAKGWGEKNNSSYNFIKNVFSEKQSIAYANTFIGLNNWFLAYDEPIILSKRKITKTADNLLAYYKTQGYFEASVNTLINDSSKPKKATVGYYIESGKPTFLDTISVKIESPILDSIYKNSLQISLLKEGNQYKNQTFIDEANQVIKLYRNNGIYHFAENYLGFYVDSTRTDHKTNVDFIISGDRIIEENGTYINKPFNVQKIKEVTVITDYSFLKKEETYKDTVSYKGIQFIAYDKVRYNPKHLTESIFLKPGGIYKDTLRNLTRNHLKSLKNFKSTSIKFEELNDKELKMNILLTPIEKYTLGFETELTHSNIRNIGTSAKFSITDRNAFKGAELLKVSLLGSWFNSNNGPGWEFGGDVSVEIPRLVAPFGLSKLVPKEMSPRTLFSIGSSVQKNIGLDRQTFTLFSDYKWQYNAQKTIQLEIFNTQYIQNQNINEYFNVYSSEFTNLTKVARDYKEDQAYNFPNDATRAQETLRLMNEVATSSTFQATNLEAFNNNLNILNRYNIITSDFLIPTIAYSYTYNNQSNFKDNSFSFFKVRIANSGNILGLLSKNKNANNKKTFLNIPLAQYFKTDLEYKKFWDVGGTSVIGIRSFLGAIFTYDNSSVPFTKSYFAGGSNDIRAWQTYELGPGRRNTGLEYNIGSLKFLTSIEYRFDIVAKLKGAVFADAGNIWDITNSSFVDSEAKFNGLSSFNDFAVGTGFGVRYDLNFLIFRFDIGFKTHEPYLKENKWFRNYNFSSAVYNVGINYPF